MSKKFYGTNLNVFWTFDEQLPAAHVEDLTNGWAQLNSNIEWNFPDEKLVLTASDTFPDYIKCTDGTNNFYFYYIGLGDLQGMKNGNFYYERVYKLDRYMTIYWQMFQDLLVYNPNVQFVKKFYDRFIYEPSDDGKSIKTATIDFFKQIQYLKAPQQQVAMVRNYIDGSTAESLYDRQRTADGDPWDPIPDTVNFPAFDDSGTNAPVTKAGLFAKNDNNRYLYLILKSSAKISNIGDTTKVKKVHSDNNKVIVPILSGHENEMLDALFNFDTTQEYPCILDAGAANIVGFYESEIPPALLVGASINGDTKIVLQAAFEGDNHTQPIPFFLVPHNHAFSFQLSTSDKFGMSKKLMDIFNLAQSDWSPKTEPLFLTDAYYKEVHSLNQNDRLETAMSLISLTINGNEVSESGINIHSYEFFDSSVTSTYYYTDNNGNSCTNPNNPSWNSNMSNRSTSLSLSGGLYDSASASYYATNSTTQFTSIQNRKSEETQAWADFGMDTAKTVINTATSFAPTVAWGGKAASAAIGIAEQATNTALSQQRANRSLASQMANIQSSPASTVSSPYAGVCIPNIIHKDKDGAVIGYLFNTYSLEVSDFDKLRVFTDISNHGYPCNSVDRIAAFDNRQFCNILHISTDICSSTLWAFLKNRPRGIFNNQLYNSQFVAWLNTPHMIYKSNEIRNFFDPSLPDYEANLENSLPPFPDQATDINNLIDNNHMLGMYEDLSTYTDDQVWAIITKYNPRLITEGGLTFADFTTENTANDRNLSHYRITPLSTTNYTGSAQLSYKRPTLTIYNSNAWQPAHSFNEVDRGNLNIHMYQRHVWNNIDEANVELNTCTIKVRDVNYTVNLEKLGDDMISTSMMNAFVEDTKVYFAYFTPGTLTFTDDNGNTGRVIPTTKDSKGWRRSFIFYAYTGDDVKTVITLSSYNAPYTSSGIQRDGSSGDSYNNIGGIVNAIGACSFGSIYSMDIYQTINSSAQYIKDLTSASGYKMDCAGMAGCDTYLANILDQISHKFQTIVYFVMDGNNNPRSRHVYIAYDLNQNDQW